jgi:methyltransferase (TIGR00027 family)
MEGDKASNTAALTAMLRAAHQLVDDEPKIVNDPVAVRLVDDATRKFIVARPMELHSPGLTIPRAAVLLRSRYAEDLLAQAVAQGVEQLVILGAELDTFAFRQPAFACRLQIYEVDHPATQSWKRERLATAGIAVPDNLHWTPIDFEKLTLAARLGEAGFDDSRSAFFSWLGVTQYLTLPAIDATLKAVAALPSPSSIVLSFMVPDVDLPAEEVAAARAVAERAAGGRALAYTHPLAGAHRPADPTGFSRGGPSEPRGCELSLLRRTKRWPPRSTRRAAHCHDVSRLSRSRVALWPDSANLGGAESRQLSGVNRS